MSRDQILARVIQTASVEGGDDSFLARLVGLLQMKFAHWHWVGIYLLVGDALQLGPFVGKPTEHTRIPVGVVF